MATYFMIYYNGHEDLATSETNKLAIIDVLERMKVSYRVEVI